MNGYGRPRPQGAKIVAIQSLGKLARRVGTLFLVESTLYLEIPHCWDATFPRKKAAQISRPSRKCLPRNFSFPLVAERISFTFFVCLWQCKGTWTVPQSSFDSAGRRQFPDRTGHFRTELGISERTILISIATCNTIQRKNLKM